MAQNNQGNTKLYAKTGVKMIKPHRDITIRQCVNGGWILQIGCAKLPYSDITTMLSAIKKYTKDPDKLEKEYNKLNGYIHGPEETQHWGTSTYESALTALRLLLS